MLITTKTSPLLGILRIGQSSLDNSWSIAIKVTYRQLTVIDEVIFTRVTKGNKVGEVTTIRALRISNLFAPTGG